MKNLKICIVVTISFVLPVLGVCPSADLTEDCRVTLADFAVFAEQWLTVGTYTLTVNSEGVSDVSITSDTGHSGITNYILEPTAGSFITLVAPAAFQGSTFDGWIGDVSSSDPVISFTMDGHKTIAANYRIKTYTLVVNSEGISGVSIASDTGHGGMTNYTFELTAGTVVRLVAPVASQASVFAHWSGDVSSSDPSISFIMDGNKAIAAKYIMDITWVLINDPGVSGHEPFSGYMSRYETTNAQYCQFLNDALASGEITIIGNDVEGVAGPHAGQRYYNLAGPGHSDDGAAYDGAAISWTGSFFTVDSGFEDHPVTHVSWYGSMAFCNYYGYRLPTEWEWQAVADYNGTYAYGCGTSLHNTIANYRGSIHPYGTTPVGAFGLYGYGMCDMAGNLQEWTSTFDPSTSRAVVRDGYWLAAVPLLTAVLVRPTLATVASGFDCA